MFALVEAATIIAVTGRLPTAARDQTTGEWVCPPDGVWTPAQHEACGWYVVAVVTPPVVNPGEVAERTVVLNGGRPTELWTVRSKTMEELAAETATTNEQSIRDKARTALTGNGNAITQLEQFAGGTAALTNTQRDTALRDLANQQARAFKQINALIKLELRDLADTTGT